jgi:uncharacterized protein YozE (UPF0346 family)
MKNTPPRPVAYNPSEPLEARLAFLDRFLEERHPWIKELKRPNGTPADHATTLANRVYTDGMYPCRYDDRSGQLLKDCEALFRRRST